MKNQKSGKQQVVPVLLETGVSALVNPKSIPEIKWTHHHGKTADGEQVHSLQSIKIGTSLILRKNTGGPVLSVLQAEFEVAAVQILTEMGYKMQAPAGPPPSAR